MTELFVDPGFTTGWACFNGEALTGCGRLDSYKKTVDRMQYLRGEYREVLRLVKPSVVYIEGVDMRGMRGNIHAIMKGDLTRLAYLVGMYAGEYTRSLIVTPLWKGNLSKTALRAQVKLLRPEIDTSGIKEHAMDAVGMGVFLHAGRWPKKWRST
jgi:hypothetical protein